MDGARPHHVGQPPDHAPRPPLRPVAAPRHAPRHGRRHRAHGGAAGGGVTFFPLPLAGEGAERSEAGGGRSPRIPSRVPPPLPSPPASGRGSAPNLRLA